jgi:hypothetical protein
MRWLAGIVSHNHLVATLRNTAARSQVDRVDYRSLSPVPTASAIAAAREAQCPLCSGDRETKKGQPWPGHDRGCATQSREQRRLTVTQTVLARALAAIGGGQDGGGL